MLRAGMQFEGYDYHDHRNFEAAKLHAAALGRDFLANETAYAIEDFSTGTIYVPGDQACCCYGYDWIDINALTEEDAREARLGIQMTKMRYKL